MSTDVRRHRGRAAARDLRALFTWLGPGDRYLVFEPVVPRYFAFEPGELPGSTPVRPAEGEPEVVLVTVYRKTPPPWLDERTARFMTIATLGYWPCGGGYRWLTYQRAGATHRFRDGYLEQTTHPPV